jgi:hypothetical protein
MPFKPAPPEAAPAVPPRPYVRFSADLARVVCVRIAAGESLRAICAEPDMPSTASLRRWAKTRRDFAKIYNRARAAGSQWGHPNDTYCPVIAHEVVVRVSEGETLTSIADDPAMPSMGSLFYWRKSHPEFAEDLRTAREALAERFSDLGWRMAQEATPETAYLTRVRLGQLRWNAAILSPRTHARLRPAEPPKEREVQDICFRKFEIEVHPETGQHRVIAYHADPDTMRPVLEDRGPWTDPVDPIAKAAGIKEASDRLAMRLKHNLPDPEDRWR